MTIKLQPNHEGMLSFTTDGVQWAWDATSITAATECQRKYQLSILQGWTSPYAVNDMHLRFGEHYASAIEFYYKRRMTDNISHEQALVETVRKALIDSWDHERDEAGNRLPETGMPWESNDSIKNRWNLIRTIIWYFIHYVEDKHDTTQVAIVNGVPALELSFEFQFSASITYCGHLDRLSIDESARVFVMDQKTSKSPLDPNYFRNYDRSIQMSGYSLAGQLLFGAPIKGVMIDAVQIQVGGSLFRRGETYRTSDQLDEWIAETEEVIKRTQDNTLRGFFPRDTTACGYYGGCPFKEICGMSPSNRDKFLRGSYGRRERWDPIKRR